METATLGQIRKIMELLESVSSEQVKAALENGSLSRALKGTQIVDFIEFFLSSNTLHVSGEFISQVVSKSRARPVLPQTRHCEIKQNTDESEIREILDDGNGGYLFEETEACAVIAGIIARNEIDVHGILFLDSCTVSFVWSEGCWHIGIEQAGMNISYTPGLKVFVPPGRHCPATV